MRSQRDEAYVLGTLELGEADLIVTLVAAEHGKLRAVAPSARRSRKRFGGALEPLTRVRALWREREGRELHRLESLECLRSFAGMQSEPVRQAACAVLAEVTTAFAHEGQADPSGFRLIGAVLEALEQGGDPLVLVRYFEYWTLRLHGLLPELRSCPACGKPLERNVAVRISPGVGIRCRDCALDLPSRTRRLTAADRSFLETAASRSPAELPRGLARARAGGVLEGLLRGTLESFAERRFRAYRHLAAAALEAQPTGEPS